VCEGKWAAEFDSRGELLGGAEEKNGFNHPLAVLGPWLQ
jgi:hypothetical protein